ncbi:TAXI family TRAP transporter solute-binding subunit [Synergistes jonesii]|uniref:TAXI family TRAP transporter solute-binding subunit n=1 Tax=Synergistes jonesii TaxID=2754 RepID=UPI00242C26FD|nr:TAXI family TRAP transporter solute-binding subunit [Synergistes jonesii]
MKRRFYSILVLVFVLAFAFTTVAFAKNYSIVSSATGGLWYSMVSGAAALWTDKIPGVTVNVEGTAGSVENARRFASGEADFGLLHATHLMDMLNGTGVMKGHPSDAAQVLCQAYESPQYFVTLKSKNIKTVQDLRGKKVAFGAAGSGVSAQTQTVLRVLGVDVNGMEMETADAARELQVGRIDAMGFTGGFAAAITELAATVPIYVIPYKPEEIQKMADYSPFYFAGKLPANVYQGQTKDVPVWSFPVFLCAHKNVPADVVEKILKVSFSDEGQKFLKTSNKQWDICDNPAVIEQMKAPYHPGAVEYWKKHTK